MINIKEEEELIIVDVKKFSNTETGKRSNEAPSATQNPEGDVEDLLIKEEEELIIVDVKTENLSNEYAAATQNPDGDVMTEEIINPFEDPVPCDSSDLTLDNFPIKNLKIVLRDIRKDFSKNEMKAFEREFEYLKFKGKLKENKMEMRQNNSLQKSFRQEILTLEIHSTRGTKFSEYQCKICQKYFSRNDILKIHIERHYKPSKFECKKCLKFFRSKFLSKAGNHRCGNMRNCKYCSKSFNVASLSEHVKKNHANEIDWIYCDICGEKFKNKAAIQKHYKNLSCKYDKIFICDFCGRKYVNDRSALISHMMMHKNQKVECKICKVKLKPHGLNSHMALVHSSNNFKCDICKRSFKNRLYLKNHQKNHKKQQVECKICGCKFVRQTRLDIHMKFHENPEQFKCKICGHQSREKHDLRKHFKTHDKTREKRLKCDRCNYQCDKIDHFRVHQNFHKKLDEKLKNNPKAVKCENCFRVLDGKNAYTRHLKLKHNDKKF